MRITTISTEGLGDRSYVVDDGQVAVVVDPQRDVDRVLATLADLDVRLVAVLETHIHNDYVSGGLALARMTGARYLVNGDDPVTFDREPIADGGVVAVGDLAVRAVSSPGHTHTHLSYVVAHDGDEAVFTGGSMLYGTVGRTDLLGPAHTDALSRAQHSSVRGLAGSLDGTTAVYPTHGFGSFCASAGGGDRDAGTIADERRENIACTTDDEDAFVETLLAGLTAHPPYYAHMGPLNLAGPQAPDLSPPQTCDLAEVLARIDRGDWVLDVRDRRAFAAAHVAGSISAEASGSMATYVGWAIPWGTPITLLADTAEQIATAQRELVRIGLDRPLGMAVGVPDALGPEAPVTTYRVASFSDVPAADDVLVVDVRRPDEWAQGHLEGAVHLPLERIAAEAHHLPDDRELWVHCQSGYRSSIGASLMARAGKDVVLIDDDWDSGAPRAPRPVVTPDS
ncbi:rhodanese-like domain-containing protein [Euzebya sp.]|uniref:MBL fold metallo-hydrolase n=1 Tax=Euzebya sp. TaxID=1971409 RepID=UPI0035184C07